MLETRGTVADWSPDGKWLIFGARGPERNAASLKDGLWVTSAQDDSKPWSFLETPCNEESPAFSPDGQFVAYGSDKTNRSEIYVRPFAAKEPEWKVSIDGGIHPRWRSQTEINFLSLDGMMMSARVNVLNRVVRTTLQELFQTDLPETPNRHPYAVAKDGQRFLMPKSLSGEAPGTRPVIVWTNWTARLRQRGPDRSDSER